MSDQKNVKKVRAELAANFREVEPFDEIEENLKIAAKNAPSTDSSEVGSTIGSSLSSLSDFSETGECAENRPPSSIPSHAHRTVIRVPSDVANASTVAQASFVDARKFDSHIDPPAQDPEPYRHQFRNSNRARRAREMRLRGSGRCDRRLEDRFARKQDADLDQLKDQFATFSVRAHPTPARRHYVDKSFRESLDKPFDKADGKAGGKPDGNAGGKPDGKGDANPVEKSSSKVFEDRFAAEHPTRPVVAGLGRTNHLRLHNFHPTVEASKAANPAEAYAKKYQLQINTVHSVEIVGHPGILDLSYSTCTTIPIGWDGELQHEGAIKHTKDFLR